jgi:serine/threonine-protein kinase
MVLDVDRAPGGQPYLVCEYLQGVDLSEHLKKHGKLDAPTAIHITRQICQGLAAAHARGVIHRDLKPQNVFLMADSDARIPPLPAVKVVDFGLSRFLDSGDDELTKTGVIMGTPAFMSPEQASAKRVDHRTDVYGVGAILYKVLTGHAPFERDNPQATVLAVLSSEPVRPRSLEPSISEHMEIVIQRAMARDPGERYPDMLAVDRALEQIEQESLSAPSAGQYRAMMPTATGSRGSRGDDVEDVKRTRLRLAGLLLLAILGVLASGAVAITGAEQAAGLSLGGLELGLLLLAVFGSAFTPAILWLRSIRTNVWENSSKVLLLLGHVRAALVTAVSVVGLGTLGLHLVDDVLLRFIQHPHLAPVGATWPGWSPVLVVAALMLAVMVVLRRRLLLVKPRPFVRVLWAWVITGAGVVSVLAVLYAGLLLRERMDPRAKAGTSAAPR